MQRCMFIHSGGRRSCHIQHTFLSFLTLFLSSSFLFQSGISSLKREPSWCSLDWKRRRRETHPVRIDTRLSAAVVVVPVISGAWAALFGRSRGSQTGPLTGFENVGLLILSAVLDIFIGKVLFFSLLFSSSGSCGIPVDLHLMRVSRLSPCHSQKIVIQCSIKRDSSPCSLWNCGIDPAGSSGTPR